MAVNFNWGAEVMHGPHNAWLRGPGGREDACGRGRRERQRAHALAIDPRRATVPRAHRAEASCPVGGQRRERG